MRNRFYMICTRDTVGSNASFHCVDGRGYHTDISKAETYTREEAQRAWNVAREIDLPISADHVDELSVYHVDCQKLPVTDVVSLGAPYVAFCKNRWDGNDVYWITKTTAKTDFSQALKFDQVDQELNGVIWVSFALADAAKRKTFCINLIDKKTMVQGAGLKTPNHIKKINKRIKSGRVRWNCPCCGRINWQYNPYDFAGCSNVNCNEWPKSLEQIYD